MNKCNNVMNLSLPFFVKFPNKTHFSDFPRMLLPVQLWEFSCSFDVLLNFLSCDYEKILVSV